MLEPRVARCLAELEGSVSRAAALVDLVTVMTGFAGETGVLFLLADLPDRERAIGKR